MVDSPSVMSELLNNRTWFRVLLLLVLLTRGGGRQYFCCIFSRACQIVLWKVHVDVIYSLYSTSVATLLNLSSGPSKGFRLPLEEAWTFLQQVLVCLDSVEKNTSFRESILGYVYGVWYFI